MALVANTWNTILFHDFTDASWAALASANAWPTLDGALHYAIAQGTTLVGFVVDDNGGGGPFEIAFGNGSVATNVPSSVVDTDVALTTEPITDVNSSTISYHAVRTVGGLSTYYVWSPSGTVTACTDVGEIAALKAILP